MVSEWVSSDRVRSTNDIGLSTLDSVITGDFRKMPTVGAIEPTITKAENVSA
jgi:hypothetical protein